MKEYPKYFSNWGAGSIIEAMRLVAVMLGPVAHPGDAIGPRDRRSGRMMETAPVAGRMRRDFI